MLAKITAFDYVLLPFYLWIIYKIAFHYRDKLYPEGHAYRPYFINGLTAKIMGALFIGIFYNYYYGGGDTLNYFFHATVINSTFTESIPTWFRLIFHEADTKNIIDSRAVSQMYWYDATPTYTTSVLGALIGILCFTKYLIINAILASLTFISMWLMFITFARQYPNILKPIAIAILFTPSTVVWGSGLFKDSFCMMGIGFLIYGAYMLFEIGKFKKSTLLLMVVGMALLFAIKAYILVALFPFIVLKTILAYKKKLMFHPEKKGLFYTVLIIFSLLVIVSFSNIAQYLSSFSVDSILETIKAQKDFLLRVSIDKEGSAYDLGDFDPSIGSVMSKFFPAVNVTLFRPYPWESKNAIQLFNSVESTGVLLLFIYLLLTKNIFKTIKNIYNDPNLIMCLFFTLLFAFFVGVSTYNFGTLSRYKIPCTPFYMLFLMILIFNKEPSSKNTEEASIANSDDTPIASKA